jgi:hypothetical protein
LAYIAVDVQGLLDLGATMIRRAAGFVLLLAPVLAISAPSRTTFARAKCCAVFEGGATYYVAHGGSDANSGKSPSTAWRTIAHVNTRSFKAHDKVLFQGGQSFSGGIVLTQKTNPLGVFSIGSYGSGLATIRSGNTAACVSATNVAALTVDNIVCIGGGDTVNSTAGISIINDGRSNLHLAGPTVTNTEVSGYGGSCIIIKGTTGNSGFNNVNISSNAAHDCTGKGTIFDSCITVAGSGSGTAAGNFDVVVAHNAVYNCIGTAGLSDWSGSGIVVDDTQTALIEYNVAHDFGASQTHCGGALGIGAYQVANATIQFNEAYNGMTGAGGCDGDGFDLDGGAINSVMQYNYSHSNVGAGFLVAAYTGTVNNNSVVRFNISQDDGANSGALSTFAQDNTSSVKGCQIYNNTSYSTIGYAFFGATSGAGVSCQISNNIFYRTHGEIMSVTEPSSLNFTGNDYFGHGAIIWNSNPYSTFGAWQAATNQEKAGGTNMGQTVEPQLVVYGGGPTRGIGYSPSSLTEYQLQLGSPMLNAGLDLTRLYGIEPGTTDYYGVAVSAHSLPIGAGQQVSWSGPSSASCSEAKTFINRTNGADTAHQQWYNGLICGLAADNIWSGIDFLYDFVTNSTTNATLNLSSTRFNPSINGTCTFTPNSGYTGDGSSCFINSGYKPSAAGNNMTKNSASFGVVILNGRSAIDASYIYGTYDGTNFSYMQPLSVGSSNNFATNEKAGITTRIETSTAQGDWLAVRTGPSNGELYRNGISSGADTNLSSALPNAILYFLAGDASGTATGYSSDTIAFAIVGAGASPDSARKIAERFHSVCSWAAQNGC